LKRLQWFAPSLWAAVWLALPVACSINLDELKAGCKAPLKLCDGKCALTCAGGSGGTSGSSQTGGGEAGTGDVTGTGGNGGSGDNGGTAGLTSGGSGGQGATAGTGGGPVVCDTVSYPFHYDPSMEIPPRTGVDSASISGDFIGWNSVGLAMTMDADGVFRRTLDVPKGPAQYKFIVMQGGVKTWVADPENPESVSDGNNGRNSILDLKCGVDYTAGGTGGTGGEAGAGG
jgi:hypothetical protein